MAASGEQRFAQQLKKGVLEMLVLQLLADRPGHGYELIVRLRASGSGLLEVKEGTLYPILYRLEEEGAVTSAWSEPDGGAARLPRRVYAITGTGRAVLAREREIWHQFIQCVEGYVGRDPE